MTFFEYKRFSSLALKRSGIALCLSDYSRLQRSLNSKICVVQALLQRVEQIDAQNVQSLNFKLIAN